MPFIRSATLVDIPAIVAIERDSSTASHWSAPQYETRIETGGVLLAEEDSMVSGKMITGFLCAHAVVGEWEIENVVVAREWRRKGIGEALVRGLMHRQAAAGPIAKPAAIYLEVRESNAAARALYEKCGFITEGRRRAYYVDPDEDALLYVWRSAARTR